MHIPDAYRRARQSNWPAENLPKTCHACGEGYVAHSRTRRWCDWCMGHLTQVERRRRAAVRRAELLKPGVERA